MKFNLQVELKDPNYCNGCIALRLNRDDEDFCKQFECKEIESNINSDYNYIRLEQCKQKYGVE